jgi:hypothetical protein
MKEKEREGRKEGRKEEKIFLKSIRVFGIDKAS